MTIIFPENETSVIILLNTHDNRVYEPGVANDYFNYAVPSDNIKNKQIKLITKNKILWAKL